MKSSRSRTASFRLARIVIGAGLLLMIASHANAADRPNVLLICVDDLRPELNCYGESIVPMLTSDGASERMAISYFKNAKTIRSATHRLIVHQSGHQELYDHTVDDGETRNVAKQYPGIVGTLQQQLNERLTSR